MKVWFAFTGVWVAAFLLYLSTAAPSLTWAHAGADGGDLISAAITNGVAHPPGYPTYVTIGQFFAQIPVGDMAYRFTLLSAVSMALAAGFTTLTVLRLLRGSVAPTTVIVTTALLAGLFFAAAPMAWGQATIAEVYGLNAAFAAVITYLVTPIVFRHEAVTLWRLGLAAWLWGVAFGNSVTVAALAPLLIVAWWRWRKREPTPRSTWLPLLAFFAGLSVYVLIPLRAAQQPPINWGDATTLERFFALVSAEMYRGYTLSTAPRELLARIVACAQLLVTQYGWPGVALGAIGMYHALVTPNKNWRWLALTIMLYLLFTLSYNTPDSATYLIPVWMFGTWAIARGTLSITLWTNDHFSPSFTRNVQPAAWMLLLIFLCGPVLNTLTHYSDMNLRDDHRAVDFARQVLTTAPPDAIVVTGSDGHTFALWYHRLASGQRPDLAIVDRRLAGYAWYTTMLQAQGSAPRLPEYDPVETWLARLAALNPGRALCVIDDTVAQLMCDE